jgi:CHAT domain-containing protein/tetratricopeptide (TPR) repeat protein
MFMKYLCLFILLLLSPVVAAQDSKQTALAERDLIAALSDPKTDQSLRAALLKTNSNIVTPRLWEAFNFFAAESYYRQLPERSIAYYEVAVQIAAHLNDYKLIATTYYNIGRTHSGLSQFRQATEAYLRSKEEFERAGLRRDCIYILGDLGALYFNLEDYQKAEDYSEQSIALAERLKASNEPAGAWPDEYGVARASATLGELSLRRGEHEQALTRLQKSLALYEQLNAGGNSFDIYIADSLAALGRVYTAAGDYVLALRNLSKSLEVMRRLSNPGRVADLFNMLGYLYMEQEDYAQAAAHYNESLKLHSAQKDRMEAARVLLNLGVIEQRQSRHESALEFFRKSSQEAASIHFKDVMLAAGQGVGVVQAEKGDYANAIATLTQTLALAKEAGDQTRQAEIEWRLAQVYYKTGDGVRAEALASNAAKLASDLRLPKLSYLAATTLGQSYAIQNKLELAAQTLLGATRQIEAMRGSVAGREEEQQLNFEKKVSPYLSLVELYAKQGKPTDALLQAEKSKGRVLLDVLAGGRADLEAALTPAERGEARRLNRQVAELTERIRAEQAGGRTNTPLFTQLGEQLDSARLRHQAFLNAVLASRPELNSRRGQTPALTVEGINGADWDANTAYLEYVVTDEQVYLFVLTKAGARPDLRVYPVAIKSQELSRKVEGFHRMLADRNPAFASAARELYELLISPAARQLSGIGTVCVVPDSFLWDVPFQALLSPNTGRYLLEDHAIYYAPSLTVLREMGNRGEGADHAKPSLIAYGNPVISTPKASGQNGGDELCPLPEAEAEVASLAQIYSPARGKAFTGREATEKSFKALAPGYRMIHLATHGILDNRRPLYSHLLLTRTAGDTENEGLLEAREIMDMRLGADLAVLSACETARGRVGAGEGVIGMSWAFFVAGVRTTVVSQWRVNSASTSRLMVNFHQALRGNQSGGAGKKADALRTAALSLMKDGRYRHPFYWAGFVMVGSNE